VQKTTRKVNICYNIYIFSRLSSGAIYDGEWKGNLRDGFGI